MPEYNGDESTYTFDFQKIQTLSEQSAYLKKILNAYSYHTLVIKNCHVLAISDFKRLAKNSPNLQSLTLENCKSMGWSILYVNTFDKGIISLTSPSLKYLRKLVLDGSDIYEFGSYEYCPPTMGWDRSSGKIHYPLSLPYLEELSLINCSKLQCSMSDTPNLHTYNGYPCVSSHQISYEYPKKNISHSPYSDYYTYSRDCWTDKTTPDEITDFWNEHHYSAQRRITIFKKLFNNNLCADKDERRSKVVGNAFKSLCQTLKKEELLWFLVSTDDKTDRTLLHQLMEVGPTNYQKIFRRLTESDATQNRMGLLLTIYRCLPQDISVRILPLTDKLDNTILHACLKSLIEKQNDLEAATIVETKRVFFDIWTHIPQALRKQLSIMENVEGDTLAHLFIQSAIGYYFSDYWNSLPKPLQIQMIESDTKRQDYRLLEWMIEHDNQLVQTAWGRLPNEIKQTLIPQLKEKAMRYLSPLAWQSFWQTATVDQKQLWMRKSQLSDYWTFIYLSSMSHPEFIKEAIIKADLDKKTLNAFCGQMDKTFFTVLDTYLLLSPGRLPNILQQLSFEDIKYWVNYTSVFNGLKLAIDDNDSFIFSSNFSHSVTLRLNDHSDKVWRLSVDYWGNRRISNEMNITLVHGLASQGNKTALAKLDDEGFTLDLPDALGMSPIDYAAMEGQLDTVMFLNSKLLGKKDKSNNDYCQTIDCVLAAMQREDGGNKSNRLEQVLWWLLERQQELIRSLFEYSSQRGRLEKHREKVLKILNKRGLIYEWNKKEEAYQFVSLNNYSAVKTLQEDKLQEEKTPPFEITGQKEPSNLIQSTFFDLILNADPESIKSYYTQNKNALSFDVLTIDGDHILDLALWRDIKEYLDGSSPSIEKKQPITKAMPIIAWILKQSRLCFSVGKECKLITRLKSIQYPQERIDFLKQAFTNQRQRNFKIKTPIFKTRKEDTLVNFNASYLELTDQLQNQLLDQCQTMNGKRAKFNILNLQGCGLSSYQLSQWIPILTDKGNELTQLNLNQNPIGQTISKNKNFLRSLLPTYFEQFCQFLQANTSIRSVHLEGCGLNDADAEALYNALDARQTPLLSLHINGNIALSYTMRKKLMNIVQKTCERAHWQGRLEQSFGSSKEPEREKKLSKPPVSNSKQEQETGDNVKEEKECDANELYVDKPIKLDERSLSNYQLYQFNKQYFQQKQTNANGNCGFEALNTTREAVQQQLITILNESYLDAEKQSVVIDLLTKDMSNFYSNQFPMQKNKVFIKKPGFQVTYVQLRGAYENAEKRYTEEKNKIQQKTNNSPRYQYRNFDVFFPDSMSLEIFIDSQLSYLEEEKQESSTLAHSLKADMETLQRYKNDIAQHEKALKEFIKNPKNLVAYVKSAFTDDRFNRIHLDERAAYLIAALQEKQLFTYDKLNKNETKHLNKRKALISGDQWKILSGKNLSEHVETYHVLFTAGPNNPNKNHLDHYDRLIPLSENELRQYMNSAAHAIHNRTQPVLANKKNKDTHSQLQRHIQLNNPMGLCLSYSHFYQRISTLSQAFSIEEKTKKNLLKKAKKQPVNDMEILQIQALRLSKKLPNLSKTIEASDPDGFQKFEQLYDAFMEFIPESYFIQGEERDHPTSLLTELAYACHDTYERLKKQNDVNNVPRERTTTYSGKKPLSLAHWHFQQTLKKTIESFYKAAMACQSGIIKPDKYLNNREAAWAGFKKLSMGAVEATPGIGSALKLAVGAGEAVKGFIEVAEISEGVMKNMRFIHEASELGLPHITHQIENLPNSLMNKLSQTAHLSTDEKLKNLGNSFESEMDLSTRMELLAFYLMDLYAKQLALLGNDNAVQHQIFAEAIAKHLLEGFYLGFFNDYRFTHLEDEWRDFLKDAALYCRYIPMKNPPTLYTLHKGPVSADDLLKLPTRICQDDQQNNISLSLKSTQIGLTKHAKDIGLGDRRYKRTIDDSINLGGMKALPCEIAHIQSTSAGAAYSLKTIATITLQLDDAEEVVDKNKLKPLEANILKMRLSAADFYDMGKRVEILENDVQVLHKLRKGDQKDIKEIKKKLNSCENAIKEMKKDKMKLNNKEHEDVEKITINISASQSAFFQKPKVLEIIPASKQETLKRSNSFPRLKANDSKIVTLKV